MNLLIKRKCYHDVEKLLLMLMLRDKQTRKKRELEFEEIKSKLEFTYFRNKKF